MSGELFDNLIQVLIFCTLPGSAGGIVSFLLAYKRGHLRNNKYIAKGSIEILGAAITSSFLIGILLTENRYQVPVAFVIGIGWSGIAQLVRTKVTKYVEATLGEKLKGGDN